jgi:hypothetical protein
MSTSELKGKTFRYMATLKIESPNCPRCGSLACGTAETLSACAEFDSSPAGTLTYSGYTEVFWDEQKTNLDTDRRTELICGNMHRWFSRMEEI